MAFTVTKLIGASQIYTTLATWEADAPVNFTTAEKSAAGTFSGTFTQGESLSFSGSGATGKFLDTDGSTYISYGVTGGNPAASDTVTGDSSGATCVLSSGTPTDTGCIWQGKINAATDSFTGSTTLLTLAGSTTSATNYYELTTNTGASFRDHANAQTNALRFNTANGCYISSTGNQYNTPIDAPLDFRMSNLQIQNTVHRATINMNASIIDNCILEAITKCLDTPGTTTTRNTLMVVRGNNVPVEAGTASLFVNCTIVCPDDLTDPASAIVSSAYRGGTFKNCAFFGFTAVKQAGGSPTFTTCYTNEASPPTGCTTLTYDTNAFQNITDGTHDYRLKSGSGLLDVGTTDATNAPNDIVGTARPQGSAYDVGCWELVAVAVGEINIYGYSDGFNSISYVA